MRTYAYLVCSSRRESLYYGSESQSFTRTVSFASKTIVVPMAQLAAKCMLGESLGKLGFTEYISILYTAVKKVVFPFIKFFGADAVLSPEMRSTGEVMGIDCSRGLAYLKFQLAASNGLPESGGVFISVKDADKDTMAELVKELFGKGFVIYAARGTSTMLYNKGIRTEAVFRISGGRPNLLDLLDEGRIQWVITTAEGGKKLW